MKATIPASECKTRAIRTAEVMEEDAAAEGGLAAEDTAGDVADTPAKVVKSVRRCTNS